MIMTALITLAVTATVGCGVLYFFYNKEKQQRIDAQAKTRALSDYISTLEEEKSEKLAASKSAKIKR
jgi:hypothetical protein